MDVAHNVTTVRRLVRAVQERKYVVPDIQRPFVWDMKRIKRLVESIIENIPIGGVVIWTAGARESASIRETASALPGYDPNNREKFFVIDGQQRLSVLYRLFEGGLYEAGYKRRINFGAVAIQPSTMTVVSVNRLVTGQIYLTDLLGANYNSFIRGFSNVKEQQYLRRVRKQILDYEIPMTIITKATLSEVRDVFLRINTLGRRVTEADAAFTKASRMNLKSLVSGFLSDLPDGFSALPTRQIQAVLALHNGATRVDSKEIQRVIKELDEKYIDKGTIKPSFQKAWKGTTRSMYYALMFLRQKIGVPDYSYLPSDLIFTILSYFYHVNQNRSPSVVQVRELRKWFWSTAFCSRYTGHGYFVNVQSDIEFMRSLARRGRSGSVHFVLKEKVPQATIKIANYRQGTSLTKAFFLILCRQGPMSFTHQYDVVPSEKGPNFARAQKHHVFPKAHLSKHGMSRVASDRLLNMCFLPALENQFVSSKAPRDYMSALKANGKSDFTKTMRSHLLNVSLTSSVWKLGSVKNAYKMFLEERLTLLDAALRKESGISIIQMGE